MIVFFGIYFIMLLFFFVYLPGRFALRIVHFPTLARLIHFPLSLGVGSSLFMFFMYVFSWLHVSFLYIFLLLPVIYLEWGYFLLSVRKSTWKFPLFESIVIFLGTSACLLITTRSGLEMNGMMNFYGTHATDSVFHMSLIGNLMHHFPPSHAGMAGVALHGYNFFYDLFVASFANLFFLNPFDLFFRFFPLFISVLYGFSCLALAKFLKMDLVTTRFFLFLAYFAQGTTFVFTFLKYSYDPGIVHPLGNIVDPSVLFSISLFFLSFIAIFSMTNRRHVLLVAVLIGIIPMIKIYTAFLLFLALGVTTLYKFYMHKNDKWLWVQLALFSTIIALIVYAPINWGVGKLVFTPFLLYTHFMESYSLSNHSDFWQKMLVYYEHHNYLRIAQNYSIIFILFFIPSLSLRLFSSSKLPVLFRKKFYTSKTVFLLSSIIFGCIIPSLFIQNIAVFVIIQFLWITYILLLIPTAYGLSSLFDRFSQPAKLVLVLFVLLISLPDTLSLLGMYYNGKPMVVNSSLIEIAKEIKGKVPQEEGLVILNTKIEKGKITSDYGVPLISALSQHEVYFEPEVLEFSGLDHEVARRKDQIVELEAAIHRCADDTQRSTITELLSNMKSKYILSLKDKACLSSLPNFTLVSQKGEAALFKLR